MTRRVVITGIGCVTPIGADFNELSKSLFAGRIGVGRLSLFNADEFPVQIAAEVRDWEVSAVGLNPLQWAHAHRQTRLALGAGLQAAAHAGLRLGQGVDPTRAGIYLGCGEPFEDFRSFMEWIHASHSVEQPTSQQWMEHGLRIFNPDVECEYEPDKPSEHLGDLLGVEGPIQNCIAACVSSTQALGEAADMIRFNETDIMLAGGSHSTIHPFGLTGFHRLSALSTRNDDPQAAVRPFDADRDGFVVGEGAAIFVLEELDHALRRGAQIWGELTGYGAAQDAFRVTDTHPDGRGSAEAMRRALKRAQLNTDDIDYINAHGTGTQLNDLVETRAIKGVFGADAYRVPISSTKSMLGHATTACGAIELAVCLAAFAEKAIPPTLNHEQPGPECDLDYVPKQARERDCRHILTNNVGFGGQNAALIVSRFDDRARWTPATRRAA